MVAKPYYNNSGNVQMQSFRPGSTFPLKSKVAGMAVFFAIDYALSAASNAGLFVIYSGI
ncbi:MAG TPA: hypothetical protein VFH09_02805 [Nitrososphaera sp.]|nr:hypothetical protein [Nitrososphaera sp.]